MATSLTNPELIFGSNQAIIAARKELAKIKYFGTNFSAEAAQPGSMLKVPIFRAGAAQAFNAASSNYETPDGAISWVNMVFDKHLHSTFEFNDTDTLATSIDLWTNAGRASGEAIGEGIVEAVMGTITKATVQNEHVFKAPNAKTMKTAVAKLRAKCAQIGTKARRTVLLVDSDIFAEILDTLDANVFGGAEAVRDGVIPGLFGFKAIMECNEFSKADGENLVGAMIQEDCLGIAGRQIVPGSPSCYDEIGTTTDPDSGLVLTTRKHGNPARGKTFCTIEALFGSALLQPTKIVRLVSEETTNGTEEGDAGDASGAE